MSYVYPNTVQTGNAFDPLNRLTQTCEATSAPAQGRQYWSIFETALQLEAALHTATPFVLIFFLPFGLVYLTLLAAMGAVLVPVGDERRS